MHVCHVVVSEVLVLNQHCWPYLGVTDLASCEHFFLGTVCMEQPALLHVELCGRLRESFLSNVEQSDCLFLQLSLFV